MGMTATEKILARNVGRDKISPKEIIEVSPDLTYSHDFAGLVIDSFFEMGGEQVWDPSKIFICLDHQVPADNAKQANNHMLIRNFVREQGLAGFLDVGYGVAHQVMVEEGYIYPGQLVVCNDSHTPSAGSIGALAIGIGETEMAFIWKTGKLWMRVPETIKLNLIGRFRDRVSSKDLTLKVISDYGTDYANYKSIDVVGGGKELLSIADRFVLANMFVEMGAKNCYFAPDAITKEFMKQKGIGSYCEVNSDANANYVATIDVDLSELGPMVALPGGLDDVVPVADCKGVKIDQAFIGSCTNGRAEDLRAAAEILKGKKVADNVRLLIAPASRKQMLVAEQDGSLRALLEAGGTFLPPGCAVCHGGHQGVLGDGEVCISSSNRNFRGRMGNPKASIYLAGPETVAAAAVAGEIVSPESL